MALVILEPLLEVEIIVLFAPQHACQRLAMHKPLVFGQGVGRDSLIKLVGISDAVFEYSIEIPKRIAASDRCQTEPDGLTAAGGHLDVVVSGRLGPGFGGIYRFPCPVNQVGMESGFYVGRRGRLAP